MFRRKKEHWLLSILILPLVHAYGPIYTEGTTITHRSIRSVGPERQRIKEELLNALGIPALWNTRSTRNTGPGIATDPTKNSFSIFMLDMYNKITEPKMGGSTEIAVLSKPALKVRKSRKSGSIPSSKTFLSNMELSTDDLRDRSDRIVTILDSSVTRQKSTVEEFGKKFLFTMKKDDDRDLYASLRIFKASADVAFVDSFGNQTLSVVASIINPGHGGTFHHDTISILKVKPLDEGWLEIDLTKAVITWMDHPERNQGIYLKVLDHRAEPLPLKHVGIDRVEETEFIPFLAVYINNKDKKLHPENSTNLPQAEHERTTRAAREYSDSDSGNAFSDDSSDDDSFSSDSSARRTRRKSKKSRRKGSRKRKNKNRNKRKKKICGKEKFYVNFREIDWGDYILAPEGYPAYKCSGKCSLENVGKDDVPMTNHAIMQAMMANIDKRIECPKCAPLKLEAMTILYMEEDTRRVTLRKYDDMVVKKCGCH
ncbi:Oidioi.mRNA.OKI2018_I69.PAR.g11615.t1.cds [Oikopleura dioica]|uniref:Oidioi.mRNA.OKI2018_I69.PAR.g11615.t1.cds n=1 Tax=Oikopleura dioica TaxID=34765 RepID=A0ABN7RZG5_OIKDI|nr:Oidioi.mRNA.OKI2018_I69.PAR.g11615.t1.cds [Oikopleura dioica]